MQKNQSNSNAKLWHSKLNAMAGLRSSIRGGKNILSKQVHCPNRMRAFHTLIEIVLSDHCRTSSYQNTDAHITS